MSEVLLFLLFFFFLHSYTAVTQRYYCLLINETEVGFGAEFETFESLSLSLFVVAIVNWN